MAESAPNVVLSGEKKLTAEIRVYCDPQLKELAGEAADAAGLPLSEYVAKTLASAIRRPDLGAIPRKSIGRPRKAIVIERRKVIGRPRKHVNGN